MKHLILKLRHIIFSWGSLKALCGIISLIILFYVEEDWRGARSLAATKAEWEAKGESFDLKGLDLPPIPDDQNLALIPLFDLVPVNGQMTPVALKKALENQDKIKFPAVNLDNGELLNLPEIRQNLAVTYEQVFHSVPPASPIDQLETLFPVIKDVRDAATTRPYCQFKIDESNPLPLSWSVELIVDQITPSRAIDLDAILALDNHQPDLAFADIKTTFDLAAGTKTPPTLIGHLVSVAMTKNNLGVIYYGLALHAWNDAQLADYQRELGSLDYLNEYQRAMRGEAIMMSQSLEYVKTQSQSVRNKYLSVTAGDVQTALWPGGWFDLAANNIVNLELGLDKAFDPGSHRVFPEQNSLLLSQLRQLSPNDPWNVLVHVCIDDVMPSGMKSAHSQVLVDEAQIACALERFHLTHNQYPKNLEELKPYADNLPNDIINGQPYHYQLRADGTYLLYSVGWNQTDEGGKIVYEIKKTGNYKPLDLGQGDWVWPSSH